MKYLGNDNQFNGLDVFKNPNVDTVRMTSDEVTAICPITNQPDNYVIEIEYQPNEWCIESKSLKLYFMSFRNKGIFGEALSVEIKNEIMKTIKPLYCKVTVNQKSRGGIAIQSIAIGEN